MHVLHSPLEQTRGVFGRHPSVDECYVFPFSGIAHRPIHTFGLRRPLRVGWYIDGHLVVEEVLRPWLGVGVHKGDTVVETHPDADLPNRVGEDIGRLGQ